MDIAALVTQYSIPVIVVICLCVGYVVKNYIPTDKVNKFIPAIMAVLGLLLNMWINMGVTPEIVAGGLVSGLASTGLHQIFVKVIQKKTEVEE